MRFNSNCYHSLAGTLLGEAGPFGTGAGIVFKRSFPGGRRRGDDTMASTFVNTYFAGKLIEFVFEWLEENNLQKDSLGLILDYLF